MRWLILAGKTAILRRPHLVHRYPDRALLLATESCAMYCRHCTRRRLVGQEEKHDNSVNRWDKAIEYIQSNKKVRDVLISGGDPLTLEDEFWICSWEAARYPAC